MANKFTKSILERQEKERKTSPDIHGSLQPAPQEANQPQIPPEQPPVIKKEEPKKQIGNLSQYLTPKKQRQARNKTYYLDEAVILAVKCTAEAEHVTESKLVNDILSKLLNA